MGNFSTETSFLQCHVTLMMKLADQIGLNSSWSTILKFLDMIHDLPVKMEKVGECICWRGGLVEMVLEQ